MANPVLTDVQGIGEAGADRLREAGIRGVRQLAKSSVEQIAEIPGFGPTSAATARRSAQRLVAAADRAAGPTAATPTKAPARAVTADDDRDGKKRKKDKKKKRKKKGKKQKGKGKKKNK